MLDVSRLYTFATAAISRERASNLDLANGREGTADRHLAPIVGAFARRAILLCSQLNVVFRTKTQYTLCYAHG